MSEKWIENQSKALADYAVLKFRGLHSEAHDHLRLYTEDVLREAMERQEAKIQGLVEALEFIAENSHQTAIRVIAKEALTAYKEGK